MAERSRPNNLPPPNPHNNPPAASRPRAANGSGAPPQAVRRNLFQNAQNPKGARRPAPVSQSSAETLRPDAEVPVGLDTSEIVVRDRHGEVELGDPPTPDLEDQGEMPLDSQQEIERTTPYLPLVVKRDSIAEANGVRRGETEARRGGQASSD